MRRYLTLLALLLLVALAGCGSTQIVTHTVTVPQPKITYIPPQSSITPEVRHPNGEMKVGAPAKPPVSLPQAIFGEKHIDVAGLHLIERFEGFSSCVYWDPYGGVYTIGYGEAYVSAHTPCESQATAQAKLQRQVETNYEWSIRALGVDFNQNQWNALCSFDYNLGAAIFEISPSLRFDLQHRQFYAASRQMLTYDIAGGAVLGGLRTRREDEVQLFLTPPHEAAPETPSQRRAREERELAGHKAVLNQLRVRQRVLRRELAVKGCYPRLKAHRAGPVCKRYKREGNEVSAHGKLEDREIRRLEGELR
jgi:lysozyme